MDEVADFVCVSFSSSSWRECNDRKDPKILEGLVVFWSVRARNLGLAGRSAFAEMTRSRSGLEGVVGDAEVEVVKKEAGLRFFFSITGTYSDDPFFSSCIEVRCDSDGRKMVKLFRRRLSAMVSSWVCEAMTMTCEVILALAGLLT